MEGTIPGLDQPYPTLLFFLDDPTANTAAILPRQGLLETSTSIECSVLGGLISACLGCQSVVLTALFRGPNFAKLGFPLPSPSRTMEPGTRW